MAWTVREAQPGEEDEVLAMYEWLFAPPGSEPPGWDRAAARVRLGVALESIEAAFLVAEEDGALIGLCSVCLDLNSVRFGQRCWVEDLATDPAQRSRGVGHDLLAAAREWARERGATHLELDSGAARKDAHRFYEREGPSWSGMQYSWWLG
jgi:GNAT superfamily N-acetyltransferase